VTEASVVDAGAAQAISHRGTTMTIGLGNLLGTLRERYSDPLLTVLTALLLFLMFVVAPLQAVGIVVFQAFGIFAALAMMTGVARIVTLEVASRR
jgi:hypothetical protein